MVTTKIVSFHFSSFKNTFPPLPFRRGLKRRWDVSTKSLVYGGKEADIGITLKDTLTVTNTGKPRTFTVALADEERCNSDMRFEIVIKPREFKLEKVSRSKKLFFILIFYFYLPTSNFL